MEDIYTKKNYPESYRNNKAFLKFQWWQNWYPHRYNFFFFGKRLYFNFMTTVWPVTATRTLYLNYAGRYSYKLSFVKVIGMVKLFSVSENKTDILIDPCLDFFVENDRVSTLLQIKPTNSANWKKIVHTIRHAHGQYIFSSCQWRMLWMISSLQYLQVWIHIFENSRLKNVDKLLENNKVNFAYVWI